MTDGMGAALDGASCDTSVSGDAMRWSPRHAAARPDGVDCSTGLREAIGGRLRRLWRLPTAART
jgi:hypothetical protein